MTDRPILCAPSVARAIWEGRQTQDRRPIEMNVATPILSGPPRHAITRDTAGVLHVVAMSGGKDSTAMALELRERMPETPFLYVCTPTGDELPEMYAHWARCGRLLGSTIWPLSKGHTLASLIAHFRAVPNFRQRWCTRVIKIEPYAEWLSLQVVNGPVRSYVGLRADETEREGGDYCDISFMSFHVAMEFPMREWRWTLEDVLASLDRRGVCIPRRTDCAHCYHQTIHEWWLLWSEAPDLYDEGEAWEEATGFTLRTPGRDTWPISLKGLRAAFEAGRIPKPRKRDTQCRACSK